MKIRIVLIVGYCCTLRTLSKIIKNHPNALFLVDNPYNCELLEKLGQPYKTIENFVTSDDLIQMGEDNYKVLDNYLSNLEKSMKEMSQKLHVEFFYVEGLIHRLYFTLKRVLDCIGTAEHLSRSIEKNLEAHSIWIYSNNYKVSYSPQNPFCYESFFVRALEGFLDKEKIKLVQPPITLSSPNVKALFRIVARKFKYLISGFFKLPKLIGLYYQRDTKSVLFTSRGYDLFSIYSYLLNQEDRAAIQFNTFSLPAWSLNLLLLFFRGKFYFKSFNLFNYFIFSSLNNTHFELSTKKSQALSSAFFSVLKNIFFKDFLAFNLGEVLAKNYNVKLALSPCIASSNEGAFLHGLSQGGSQTFHYQHGGGQGYLHKPMFEWFFSQTDILFCYGEAVKNHMKFSKKIRVFSVGSARLEKIRSQIKQIEEPSADSLKVVCVPAGPTGYRSYFPEIKRSDLFYYNIWRNLVLKFSLLNKSSRHKFSFLIKSEHYLCPGADYFSMLITREKVSFIEVVVGVPFVNFLNLADIFILDSPETTLLEVMLTKKPIILFNNGGYRLEDNFKTMLEKRVYWVNNEDDLCFRLNQISLDYKKSVAEKADSSFIDYYLSKPVSPSCMFERFISSKIS